MQPIETFNVLAEVAVGFAGCASIAVLFRRRGDGGWEPEAALRYRAMLGNSLFACAFALLPRVLGAFEIANDALWASCSSLLLAYIVWRFVALLRYRRGFLTRANQGLVIVMIAAVCGFQLANVVGLPFGRGPAPYLAGVSLILVNAGINFFHLVSVPAPPEPAA